MLFEKDNTYAVTHGYTSIKLSGKRKSEYESWAAMKQRCCNYKHTFYKNYGGRGITICDRWMNFSNFLEDMGPKPTPKHSIDRIDNSGNYEPSNCKWSTRKEQTNNSRRAWKIDFGDGLILNKKSIIRLWGIGFRLFDKMFTRADCIEGHR